VSFSNETHQLLVPVNYFTCNVQISTRKHTSETRKNVGLLMVGSGLTALAVVVAKLYHVHLKVISL
jgi:hypothetical protein